MKRDDTQARRRGRQSSGAIRTRSRPTLEVLEDRRLLAITVNTLVDEVDGSIIDGDISLRDAIAASPAGGTINFSVTGTINLALGRVVVQDRILQGPGAAQLTINANQLSGVFTTDGTTTIAGMTITGGKDLPSSPAAAAGFATNGDRQFDGPRLRHHGQHGLPGRRHLRHGYPYVRW